MRRFKFLKLGNSAGDTIIEVMIVLAILSLAFVISYATANGGVQRSRNAEEHSEALGLIDSQVEELRTAYANNQDLATTYPIIAASSSSNSFCMQTDTSNSSDPVISVALGRSVPQNSGSDTLSTSAYSPSSGSGTCYTASSGGYNYYYSITYRKPSSPATASDYFDFIVRWNGLGSLGVQQEELTYRIDEITASNGNGYTDPITVAGGGGGGGGGGNNTPVYDNTIGGWPYTLCDPTDPGDSPTDPAGQDTCNEDTAVGTSFNQCEYQTGVGSPLPCMYAYRDVNVEYSYPQSATNTSGYWYINISYQQYTGELGNRDASIEAQDPPQYPNYSFAINVCSPPPLIEAPSNDCGPSQSLPAGDGSPECQEIEMSNNPGSYQNAAFPAIQIDWTNNDVPGYPTVDPNLEIISIELLEYNQPQTNLSCTPT